MKTHDSKTDKIIALTRQINDLQIENRTLKFNLQKSRDLINIAPAFFGFIDPKSGNVTSVNELALQIIHAEESDVVGRPMWEALWWSSIPSSAKKVKDAVLKGAKGIASHFDTEYWTTSDKPGGKKRWVAFALVPIFDDQGKVEKLSATGIDITGRVESNKKLHESEDKLNLALVASNIGFWEWNIKTGIVYLSDTLMHDWGIDPLKFDHSLASCFKCIHPDDQQRVQTRIERATQEHKPYDVEYRVVKPSGEVIWMNAKGRCYFDEAGQPARLSGITINNTDKKAASHALQMAKEEAERASKVKSSFLANMSHEIRTPLGAILGFSDLLRDQNLDADERASFLEIISRNGKFLTRLIDDILDLSKVEAGKLNIETVEFSFYSLLDEVVDLFKERARSKGLFLLLNINKCVPNRILSDPARLRQILVNIIGNAIKFTTEGGINVYVTAKPSNGDFQLRIDVEDTGIGLTDEQKLRLFEPFSQADNSTTRKYGGTGLGLVLSLRLARALGGEIAISNSSAAGTTFSVMFTGKIPPSSEKLSKKQINEAYPCLLKGIKVLLVDDTPDNRFLIQHTLKHAGVKVKAANDGEEAVRMALHGDFDVVLMDIQMPIMDGYQATRSLRKAGYKKPIIALTAHALAEEKDRTRAAGCNSHLTKPLNMNDLLKTVAGFAQMETGETSFH